MMTSCMFSNKDVIRQNVPKKGFFQKNSNSGKLVCWHFPGNIRKSKPDLRAAYKTKQNYAQWGQPLLLGAVGCIMDQSHGLEN